MHKFSFLAAVLLLTGSACKKTYTCSCNTTLVYKTSATTYDSKVYPGTYKSFGEKMTRKQAQSACDHQSQAIQSDFSSFMHNYATFQSGESVTTRCTLN